LEIFVEIKNNEKFVATSNEFAITSNKQYAIKTEVSGFKGKPYTGYFGVVILDNNKNEITRKIQWLNDFSGNQKTYEIVFTAPKNSDNARIIYRINEEVVLKSTCKYNLSSIDEVIIQEVNESKENNYTIPENYIKELSLEEEEILEKNIVWIFASPRSGTQWSGTQLLEFDTIICHGPSIGLNVGAIHGGVENNMIRHIEERGDEPDYFLSKRYRYVWTYFLRKFILNRLHAQFQDLTKKIVIPDPEGSIGADIIASCMPNSKIIILLRDGRDVVDSVIDAAKEGSWHVKLRGVSPLRPDKRKARIELSSRRWVKQIQILNEVLNDHAKNLCHQIKYEDLRNNTFEELKRIYDFIGIRIPDKELEKIVEKYSFENIPQSKKGSGKVTRSASPGKWKENFSQEEQKIMNDIMKETLNKLGYD
jgi:hypothetical protein